MIVVDYKDNQIEIKILKDNWDEDLARVKSIHGRRFEPTNKTWVIPSTQIEEIVAKWKEEEIVYSGNQTAQKVEKFKEGPIELGSKAPITQILEHTMPLKWYQERFVRLHPSFTRVLLSLVQGAGKCFQKDTPILMFDGTIKTVQDVKVGDLLMGPEGIPRTVTSLARGREEMFKVIPVKGNPFTCNASHIMSFKYSGYSHGLSTGDTIAIPLKEFLNKPKDFQFRSMLYRSEGLVLDHRLTKIDAYFLGLWLGDSHSNYVAVTTMDEEVVGVLRAQAELYNLTFRVQLYKTKNRAKTYYLAAPGGNGHKGGSGNLLFKYFKDYNLFNNKHVPLDYKLNSTEVRLQLLAGMIDSDGHMSNNGYDWINKNKVLAEDFTWLCRSVGLSAYMVESKKGCTYKGEKREGTYFRVSVSGHTDKIPCRLPRKQATPRLQRKNSLVTNFTVEAQGVGDYYGFEIDGPDRLFLLADFTVVHNSLASLERIKALQTIGKTSWERILIIAPKRVRRNWRANIRNVLGAESVIYWAETKAKRMKLVDSAAQASVVICTYETVKELHERVDVKYDHLIVDEAHLLANPDSKRSRDFDTVNDRYGTGKPILLLTGTPIQDKPQDLWNPLRIVNPEIAGNRWAWNERYTRVLRSIRKPIPVKRNGVVQRDETGRIIYRMTDIPIKTTTQNLPDLQRRLSTCMFRVAKEDIFDFEDVIEPVIVEMYPAQRRIYEQIRDEIIVEIENRTLTIGQVPTRMLRLLQACEGIFNFTPENKTSSKLDYLKELIEEFDDDKQLIVWSRFQPITFELQRLFPDKTVVFNGAMSDSMNQLAVWAFNGTNDRLELEEFKKLAKRNNFPFGPGEARILSGVIDLKSSLGVDLHEQGCNHQIFPSFSFMGAANDQAGARITRQGQRKDLVLSQYLLCEDTIEFSAWSLVLNKWKTTLQILDGIESLGYQQSNQLLNLLKA